MTLAVDDERVTLAVDDEIVALAGDDDTGSNDPSAATCVCTGKEEAGREQDRGGERVSVSQPGQHRHPGRHHLPGQHPCAHCLLPHH